jgi:hypothetical protein
LADRPSFVLLIGPSTFVLTLNAFDVAETRRQHGLRALKCLTLTLLVHAQDQRILERAQIQADDVAQFLDEERIGRQFEALASMGLQTQQLEVTVFAGRRDRCFGRDRAYAPVRGSSAGFVCRVL